MQLKMSGIKYTVLRTPLQRHVTAFSEDWSQHRILRHAVLNVDFFQHFQVNVVIGRDIVGCQIFVLTLHSLSYSVTKHHIVSLVELRSLAKLKRTKDFTDPAIVSANSIAWRRDPEIFRNLGATIALNAPEKWHKAFILIHVPCIFIILWNNQQKHNYN